MLPELTQEELSQALDQVAADAVTRLDQTEPPVDALVLARALGLTVAWDDRQSGRARIVRLGEFAGTHVSGSILVRPDPRPERLQWAVAHEIGETCAVQVFDRLRVDPREAPPAARETVANQLAGRMLLPREWFAEAGADCGWNLAELKRRFSTASHELIARRMLDFSVPIAITIFDQGRRTFRRGNTGRRLPSLVPVELAACRAAHDKGEPVVESGPLCCVQAWPVHEPEWKREILRTEWHALDDDQIFEA
jgi:predicted transcriptional regulator